MTAKKGVIATLVLLIGIAVGVLFFQVFTKSEEQPVSSITPTPEEINPSMTLKEYSDESGFVIEYPDDLSLKREDVEDESVYSKIAISSSKASGNVSIKVTETKYTTFAKWLDAQDASLKSWEAKEINLGDLTAYEITTDDKTQSIAVDQGVLFVISLDAKGNEKYWESIYKTVVSSLRFSKPESTTSGSSSGTQAESDVILEEEIIE